MGNNFYVRGHVHSLDPEYHIAKVSFGGDGMLLIWAMDPKKVKDIEVRECPCCHTEYKDNQKIIEDEYNILYTIRTFEAAIRDCKFQDYSNIGSAFS